MFRVGQKIVCVDASGTNGIVENGVYTVSDKCPECAVDGFFGPMTFISIVGEAHDSGLKCNGWRASRFRPLVERKTDISIFTKMLTPQPTVDRRQPAHGTEVA